jgi:hypothetical protein
MNSNITYYLTKLKNKFDIDQNKYQAYKIINSKLSLFANANTKNDINKLINDELYDDIDKIIIISYRVSLKNYMIGPLSINCIIYNVINSKLSKIWI